MIRQLAVVTAFTFVCLRAVDSATPLRDNLGPRFEAAQTTPVLKQPKLLPGADALAHVVYWNRIAIDASGLDHTPPAPGENRVFHEQLGPGRSSRAIAITQIAIFDAINAVTGRYESYTGIPRVHARTYVEPAIAQAAHDTLVALYPAQATKLDQLLAEDLGQLNRPNKNASPAALLSANAPPRPSSPSARMTARNVPSR